MSELPVVCYMPVLLVPVAPSWVNHVGPFADSLESRTTSTDSTQSLPSASGSSAEGPLEASVRFRNKTQVAPRVTIRGLPAPLCNDEHLRVVFELAGLEKSIVEYSVQLSGDIGTVSVIVATVADAKYCADHFNGRTWGLETPVSAHIDVRDVPRRLKQRRIRAGPKSSEAQHSSTLLSPRSIISDSVLEAPRLIDKSSNADMSTLGCSPQTHTAEAMFSLLADAVARAAFRRLAPCSSDSPEQTCVPEPIHEETLHSNSAAQMLVLAAEATCTAQVPMFSEALRATLKTQKEVPGTRIAKTLDIATFGGRSSAHGDDDV